MNIPLMIALLLVVGGYDPSGDSLMNSPEEQVHRIQQALRKNPPLRFRNVVLERQARRRVLQQQSYAGILYEIIGNDPLGGLFSYVKANLQMEFSLSHGFLYWIVPPDETHKVPGIPFEEDESFPIDPWGHE